LPISLSSWRRNLKHPESPNVSKKTPDTKIFRSSGRGKDEPDMLQTVLPINAIREGFRARFEVVPAFTEALKEQVYRLRHGVYCEDLGWEAIRPSGQESDEYDAHSVHILLRHIATGENVGCVRMVLARPEDPAFRLPFERVCDGKLDATGTVFDSLPRDKVAEISRLAVISKFRRRQGEARRPVPGTTQIFGTESAPRFPYILVGLYVGIVVMAKFHGIGTLFVLTEPRLAEHFKKIGVTEIKQIGSPVEHRGMRIPSLMPVDGIIDGFCMNPLIRPIYDSIYDQISSTWRV
jgi:N-acyl amino acid synthase of PEP-CTERM/exosortase system